MNGPRREFVVRRIVVAADASPHGDAALEAAVRMADRLRAQLQGLFIEDIDLVNLSQLPLGRELHPISGQKRDFDSAVLEEGLRRDAARTRRALEARAVAARVRHSFRVVRGRIEGEVIAAAGEADLLVLGVAGRAGGVWRRSGSAVLAAARQAPHSVLLLGGAARPADHALVAYDGADGATLVLDAALHIVRDPAGELTIMLVAPDPDSVPELRRQAESHLAGRGATANFVYAETLEPAAMCRLAGEVGSDILVIAADTPSLAGEGVRALIEGIACPVLLVR